jgi:tRNA-splicing ligase RtcB
MPLVERRIPAGMGKAHAGTSASAPPAALAAIGSPATELTDRQRATAAAQFGTLGSGNHFVEVCLDEREVVWLVLHSGSRGIGNQLAQRAVQDAKGLMQQWFIELPDPDLAYLVQGTPEFDAVRRRHAVGAAVRLRLAAGDDDRRGGLAVRGGRPRRRDEDDQLLRR